ncbi:MAG: RES family NAD+ phosphorylase [Massilia sp.]
MARGDRHLWRVAKHSPLHHAAALDGMGAKLTGGRWNSKGKSVVYASSTIALATLETLVHLVSRIGIRNAFLVDIVVPGPVWKARHILRAAELDPTWVCEPPALTSMFLGDRWLSNGDTALMLVPSVIVPEEYNILINPAHRQASGITAAVARQYLYDPRLGPTLPRHLL